MNEIDELVSNINEYQKEHGEDKVCLVAKAKLFDMIGEYKNSLFFLTRALEFDTHDVEVLYSIGAELEKIGDLAKANLYYAKAAKEMKEQNLIDDYNELVHECSSFPEECRNIFETVLNNKTTTFIFLSICGFGLSKQRYQNLAVALAELGNTVIYVNPNAFVDINGPVTSEALSEYVLSHASQTEGIVVLQPLYERNNNVDCLPTLVAELSNLYENGVFIVSNIGAYEALKNVKGKNKIIFDCADDNSDYKNAFWSSKEIYNIEQELVNLADDITCTAASLYLRKAVIENRSNVYLSQNAVSATELQYGCKAEEPEDLKDIPHPRIGYVGVIYQRFDRETFYRIVKQNPDKSFVIIGSVMNDYITKKYKNMYFLGTKSHAELGAYYQNMDICLIPYFDDAKMSMSCDPVKLHEHICCGVPTITTYMPDTAVDRPMVYHANNAKTIQQHIDSILKNRPSMDKKELDYYLARHSWISRACQFERIANNSTLLSENRESVVLKIKDEFSKIKNLHPNFRIIYAITLWNENYEECKKEIEIAYKDSKSEYNKEIVTLFNKKQTFTSKDGKISSLVNVELISKMECTGCSSCFNSCPTNAITMEADNFGFLFPTINRSLCVNCGNCLKKCPLKNSMSIGKGTNDSYAIMASNEIRIKSSSGGIFNLLATKTIKNGGYVCGAIYDEEFNVKHIVSNDILDIEKMQGSKYVQSVIGNVYSQVKELIEQNKRVLFTGCPCQVSGLYSFLGENPDNLLTISLVCAGVPSPEMYRQHIDGLSKANGSIKRVNFRDKTKFGWNTGLTVKFENGNEYVASVQEDSYLSGFLAGMFIRESCYNCKFKKDIYSDIVLGDYWGINSIMAFDDGLGTSYISVNSRKGEEAIKDCSLSFIKMAKIPKQYPIILNPRIRSSMPIPMYRDRFIENFKENNDFEEAYVKTFTENKYDAVLVLWWSSNYGNALTNYALYTSLESMGLNLLAIDNLTVAPMNQFRTFAEKYFNLSSYHYPQGSFDYIARCSENYIVGSDQVWNKTFSQVMGDSGYFQLKFVSDDKNKISYGSSFGQTSDAIEDGKLDYYKSLYKRLNSVSLREQFGVKIMKKLFGVDATYVLDPVFLPTKKDYLQLANKAEIKCDKRFIVSYILTPNEEKKEYLLKLQEKLGNVELINIIDAEPARRSENIKKFNIGNLKVELSPEEFLYYFANSEFVVTDSYHGTCFAMIFEKRFVSFINRESERFETFKEFEECKNRVLDIVPTFISEYLLKEIDYKNTKEKINAMRSKSFEYLKKSLKIK